MAEGSEGIRQGAQAFAHLGTPLEPLYREILKIFARAKDRFIVHLRPEDVAAELGRAGDEALEKLVGWGNLRADADTGRVTSVEDFHRKRFLFQLMPEGFAAEQAIALYEESVGRRGALQSVALADIADRLGALLVLAAEDDPDPGKTHLLLALAEVSPRRPRSCAALSRRGSGRSGEAPHGRRYGFAGRVSRSSARRRSRDR